MQGFVLKWHGHNFGQMFTIHWKVIANSQPEFECQPLSYKQDTDFLVLWSKFRSCFFLFWMLKKNKSSFTIWMTLTIARNYLFMNKTLTDRKNMFEKDLLKYIEPMWTKHWTSLFYIAKNCELCIFLIFLRLSFKFWSIIRIA